MIKDDSDIIKHVKSENINNFKRYSLLLKKKSSKNYDLFKSKWSNLKCLIQDKTSLKSSIDLQKTKTIEQFSSKCIEIYKKKLEIKFIIQKNREMFTSLQFNYHNNNTYEETNLTNDEMISQLQIRDIKDAKDIKSSTQIIRDFFFKFRENNILMMRLIECLDPDQFEIIVPFLCHFFYENFYIENNEQEEILYIIYLLLEKEIDSLYTPSVSTFLDKSFVSMFLSEMGNKYEIKHYIDIILNYLIRNIEEINISFYNLDLEAYKKDKNFVENINEINEKSKSKKKFKIKENKKDDNTIRSTYNISNNFNLDNGGMSTGNILKRKNLFDEDNIKTYENINETKLNMREKFKKELYDILFYDIDEKYLRNKFENENDELLKHFYARLLRQINSSSNPDLYNTNKYFEKLIDVNQKIPKEALEDFNKGYYLVTKFITELLDNLEDNQIMPYSIKVICKFIFKLLKKKFKTISKIQQNILVNRFLFDKLLLPVLQNPDINDTGKNMIITLNTRKNLYYIYQVLKKLIRGELFDAQHFNYMTVFNRFIIDNFQRLNKIMNNLLKVKVPEKLEKLCDEFYKDESFNLDEIIRDEKSLNYDYFKENPHDSVHHKSICFSIKELKLFFNTVNTYKERFLQGDDLENIFTNLSKLMNNIKFKPYEYYVIIGDDYNKKVANKLFIFNESNIALGKAKKENKNDIFINLKFCINYLISKLDIFPSWAWATKNLNTIKTFEFINSYLNIYYDNKKKLEKNKVPLNWYSTYIIKNLKNLEKEYIVNDFQLLYDSLEAEILSEINDQRTLNKFLTINMMTKNVLIDKKIKLYEKELDNVKSTELNIKTAKFIESAKINVCLTNYLELNDMIKYLNSPLDPQSQNQPYILLISKESECIHRQKIEKRTLKKLKNKLILSNTHCSNINEFTQHLSDYYYLIGQDILESYKIQEEKKHVNENLISKKTMVKEIMDNYKKYVIETMNESNLFNKNSDKSEEEKNKSLNMISNYILKRLSIKIYEAELDNQDQEFKNTCIKLKWLTHTNLEIPNEVFNKNLFDKVIDHVKRMDYLRTPYGMLYEFGMGVQLINSMFIFMLNQMQAEAGDLLPLIIYSIIAAKPKRLIFNIKFIKFFMNQNELLGSIGYNLIQCESSIRYIKSLNEVQLKMDKEEFDNKCKLCFKEYELKKKNKEKMKKRDYKTIKLYS